MKAVLKFDLADEDDKFDFLVASKSREMGLALWRIQEMLIKHRDETDVYSEDETTSPILIDKYEYTQALLTEFFEICNELGCNPYEVCQ